MAFRSVRRSSRLDTGVLLACGLVAVIAIVLPDRLREPVATGFRRTLLTPLLAVQQFTESMRAAVGAREASLRTSADVTARAGTATALRDENAALRRLLGLAGRLREGFVIAEAFHSSGLVDDFTLTIAAGSRAGIAAYTPVVTAEGLVGMVEAVDPSSSTAITWAHPDFRVSAVSADETAFGIVQPYLVSGPERYLLQMRGVPFRASLEPGALIVSSGLGGPFPRGIAIGTVIGEVPTTERWSRTYLLKPSVLPTSLSAVVLMRSAGDSVGVGSVWTRAGAADSAIRAIVASSDSAARAAALAELRARRAVLDAAADSAYADSALAGLGPVPTVRAPALSPAVPKRLSPGRPDTVRPPAEGAQ